MTEITPLCQRCGACLAVCPVFAAVGTETVSPRGKLAVRAEADRSARASLSLCLLCGRCARACPSGVPADQEILAARLAAAREEGLPLPARLLSAALREPRREAALARALRAFERRLARRGVAPEAGVRLRLAGLLGPGAPVPSLDHPFLSERLKDRPIPGSASGPHVTLFPGCSLNYLFPEAGERAVQMLAATGARVLVPEEPVCCGLPALGLGDEDAARRLALRNVASLLSGDPAHVAVPCPSCRAMMAHHYPRLLADTAAERDARALAARLTCFYEFAGRNFVSCEGTAAWGVPLRVAYHRACHAADGDGERRFLSGLSHVRLVPEVGEDSCCGGGGSFMLAHRAVSAAIGRRRARSILRAAPEAVATGCPGCILQLRASLARLKRRLPVLHTLELADPRAVERVRGER